MNLSDALNLGYKADNKQDLLNLIDNNDPIDLISIQANKLLKDIKRMIGIKFNDERANKIDNNFITSLKKMIVICNNQISSEYLTELSYVYYATYNNTLDIYYSAKEKSEVIYYFMLNEDFNNSINVKEEYNWNEYDESTLKMLDIAYKNGIFNEIMNILKINPKFTVMPFRYESILEKKFFNEFIETFGIEGLAKGNMFIMLEQFVDSKNFIKKLRSINPSIVFNTEEIFKPIIKECFDINKIAFFKEEDKSFLKEANQVGHCRYFNIICEYYNELLEHIEEDNHRDFTKEIDAIEYLAINNSLPPELYLKLTSDEIEKLAGSINAHVNKLYWSEFYFGEERNINSFLKKLNKKYGNPKQKKLKR